MPPSLKTNARPVTGEAQASNTTFSDADLNKLTVGSSYLLTEKVHIFYLLMLFLDLKMLKMLI